MRLISALIAVAVGILRCMPDHLSRDFPDEFRLDAGRGLDTQSRPTCLVIQRILVSGNAARPIIAPRENGGQKLPVEAE
jgi:hypothetical protein